jgi:N-dimethylarginine dimethylaminohydrolase
MFNKINSHNEWDTLKEVIVGTAKGTVATLTWDKKKFFDQKIIEEAQKLAKQSYPKLLLDEVEEDLNEYANTLKKLGAVVHRPKAFDLSNIYSSPFWSSNSTNLYNVRDLNLVVGNQVIESPSYLESRYYEATSLYDIFYKYFEKGFKWTAGPKPRLDYEALQPYYRDENQRVLSDEDTKYKILTKGRLEKLHKLAEKEILFEAANTLRMGKDLLYLLSSSGNELGAKWLQSAVGEDYKVHVTRDLYRSSHIDSTLMALKPGVLLVNSVRVNEKNIPKIFDKWKKIYFEDVASTPDEELEIQKNVRDPMSLKLKDLGFKSNLEDMASPWVGMNVLSFDQKTVLVEKRQEKLIKVLESNGFDVVPIQMRHMYIFSGGLHCTSLDTVRDSTLENYF